MRIFGPIFRALDKFLLYVGVRRMEDRFAIQASIFFLVPHCIIMYRFFRTSAFEMSLEIAREAQKEFEREFYQGLVRRFHIMY